MEENEVIAGADDLARTAPDRSIWFGDRPGRFILFRVNRRPWPDLNLLTPEKPEDVFRHFLDTLTPGLEVVTGRSSQRTWKVGGLQSNPQGKTLVGKLGWEPVGLDDEPRWSAEEMDWLPGTVPSHGGRVAPFAFDGATRLLTVLRDSRASPSTQAAVLQKILRTTEGELENPSTEWSVELVLDGRDFITWLSTLDVVREVGFTARLPNPEPRDEFRELGDRIESQRATSFTEIHRSDREEGLADVQEDRDFRQAIAMGEHGFATLRGKGTRDGSESRYSQSDRVASESVEEVPPNWEQVWELMKHLLQGNLRRFLGRGEAE